MSTESPRVLLVDDEQAVLDGLCRQHRKHLTLVPVNGPDAGLRSLAEDGPFAAVVSDYQMPGMNGAQFLERAREIRPNTTRIMLTGQADLTTAVDAVNRGNIFRFLTKPCAPDLFRAVVASGIEQYELRNAERLLLEQTVKGSIEVLADVLALTNPVAFGRATRVRRYVSHVVRRLGLRDGWRYETAALLSQIGCVAIPNDIFERLSRGERLPADEVAMLEKHPQLAHDLLVKIPRLQSVASMVRHQNDARRPRNCEDDDVWLGSRILAATLDYEELLSLGAKPGQALAALREETERHDREVLDALTGVGARDTESGVALLPLSRLQPGMRLEDEIRDRQNGTLIVARGHQLTGSSLARLRNYHDLGLLERAQLRVRLMSARSAWDSPAA